MTTSQTQLAVPPLPVAAPPAIHPFELKGVWTGDLRGGGRIEAGQLAANISVPRELGGPGKGSNPEELLLAAAASCYLITLAAVLSRRGIAAESLEVASTASFSFDGRRLALAGIEHRPRARVPADREAELLAAYQAAEAGCMVSRALNVPVAIKV